MSKGEDQHNRPVQGIGLWRHPDFLKLWAGQSVSLFGSQVSLLAIPLTAVLVLNASPLQMGLLTAVGAAPVSDDVPAI